MFSFRAHHQSSGITSARRCLFEVISETEEVCLVARVLAFSDMNNAKAEKKKKDDKKKKDAKENSSASLDSTTHGMML